MFNRALSIVPRKFTASSVPALPVVIHASLKARAAAIFCQPVPVLYQKEFVVVSYTSNPLVLGMRRREPVLMRGMSNPLSADLISTIAFGFAFDPSVLMATFCAFSLIVVIKRINNNVHPAIQDPFTFPHVNFL